MADFLRKVTVILQEFKRPHSRAVVLTMKIFAQSWQKKSKHGHQWLKAGERIYCNPRASATRKGVEADVLDAAVRAQNSGRRQGPAYARKPRWSRKKQA
jgi:hypothetical protein